MLEVTGAHVMEKWRLWMLPRAQCQLLRTVLFSDKQISLRVAEAGGNIFVLWVNSSERQARQVSIDSLGRMVAGGPLREPSLSVCECRHRHP